MSLFEIQVGDCLVKLKDLPDNSIDAIVTDPPYGISFMGKKWDYEIPSVAVWKEVLRVLKPGGHALIACGTRTQHRMVVNIEDAGFEIRDVITWLYGSGFPKSMDISKAIDKAAGAKREVVGHKMRPTSIVFQHSGIHDIKELERVATETPNEIIYKGETAASIYRRLLRLLVEPAEVAGAPATDDAKKWAGFGTALKPACEFFTLVRKPLSESTVAKNVLKWGVGGINIDGCRVEHDSKSLLENDRKSKPIDHDKAVWIDSGHGKRIDVFNPQGRFPANLILDEEAGRLLDEQSGILKSGAGNKNICNKTEGVVLFKGIGKGTGNGIGGDSAGASRFFYTAKASKRERNAGLEGMPLIEGKTMGERKPDTSGVSNNTTGQKPALNQNHHPTVKPIKLMSYLCKLITPPQGLVLDPFMGSGSTGVAALKEGFDFIGMELSEEYAKIAEARLNHALSNQSEVEDDTVESEEETE